MSLSSSRNLNLRGETQFLRRKVLVLIIMQVWKITSKFIFKKSVAKNVPNFKKVTLVIFGIKKKKITWKYHCNESSYFRRRGQWTKRCARYKQKYEIYKYWKPQSIGLFLYETIFPFIYFTEIWNGLNDLPKNVKSNLANALFKNIQLTSFSFQLTQIWSN